MGRKDSRGKVWSTWTFCVFVARWHDDMFLLQQSTTLKSFKHWSKEVSFFQPTKRGGFGCLSKIPLHFKTYKPWKKPLEGSQKFRKLQGWIASQKNAFPTGEVMKIPHEKILRNKAVVDPENPAEKKKKTAILPWPPSIFGGHDSPLSSGSRIFSPSQKVSQLVTKKNAGIAVWKHTHLVFTSLLLLNDASLFLLFSFLLFQNTTLLATRAFPNWKPGVFGPPFWFETVDQQKHSNLGSMGFYSPRTNKPFMSVDRWNN